MKLAVSNLNSFYGPAHILFDIALEVADGEVVALLGRNGAGKSTTFRSIVGLVAQRSGQIIFEGKDVSREPTHAGSDPGGRTDRPWFAQLGDRCCGAVRRGCVCSSPGAAPAAGSAARR